VPFCSCRGLTFLGDCATNLKSRAAESVRAPLRWAGSKRKSLLSLSQYLPEKIHHYVEPFAGSACLAFLIRPRSFVLGDINPNLIEFYERLQTSPERLHDAYRRIRRDPDTYYKVRERFNASEPSLKRAAQFLYLNRQCFNGIYRVNAAGQFNVPWGGDKVGQRLKRSELLRASEALKNASFVCGDFEVVIKQSLGPETFVYLDPPYASDETRVFREYHAQSFSTCDWERLLGVLHSIDKAGGRFLLSYAGSPQLAEQLGSWKVGYIDVTRNVGGFRSTRRKHREFVATNYFPRS
jgi:DNA adenine methylase